MSPRTRHRGNDGRGPADTSFTLRRVFVVDDEPVIASTLERILCRNGFPAHSFTNPITALNQAMAEPPDLLLTEVRMPDMSGTELALRIKQIQPNCTIVFVTGNPEAKVLEECKLRREEFLLLAKPVRPQKLIQQLNYLRRSVWRWPLDRDK